MQQPRVKPWVNFYPKRISPEGANQNLTMPQSLACVLVHLVFSTKDRRPLITNAVRPQLHAYLVGILNNHGSPSLITNSVADHVHILFSMSRTVTIAKLVEELKTGSSCWMKTQGPEFADFFWQNSYEAFSIGQSGVDQLKGYITAQAEHHRRVPFQVEYRMFLEKHGIEYDECYVWD